MVLVYASYSAPPKAVDRDHIHTDGGLAYINVNPIPHPYLDIPVGAKAYTNFYSMMVLGADGTPLAAWGDSDRGGSLTNSVYGTLTN